jgi:hypothetical protein
MRRRSIGRILPSVLFVAMLVTGSYAFTATNTVGPSIAGSVVGGISGYSATQIHYNLNATTPTNIDSYSFTIDPTPPGGATLKSRLQNTAGTVATTWVTCTISGTTVTCGSNLAFPLASADTITVVAAD